MSHAYVFHLFQWKEQDESKYSSVHKIAYAFKREAYKANNLINTVFKFIVQDQSDLNQFKLDKGVNDFTEDVYLYSFDTPIQGIGNSKSIGIAISNTYKLDGPIEDLNQILSELANNFEELNDPNSVPKAILNNE